MLPETITKLETAKLETIKPETAKLEARKEIRKNLIRCIQIMEEFLLYQLDIMYQQ